MRKVLNRILIILICFFSLSLIGCNQNSNDILPNDNNDNNTDISPDSNIDFKVSFKNLDEYMCVMPNASSIGIDMNGKTDNQKANIKNTAVKKYNELVYQSSFFESTDPEFDENGIAKVTFKKITVSNLEKDTTGSFQVYPTHYKGKAYIEFATTEGVKYDIYDNKGNAIIVDFTDNNTKDLNKTSGFARVECLNTVAKCEVKYKGKIIEEVITQDEIDGEVDKFLIVGQYTFISFVPKGTSKRAQYVNENDVALGSSNYDTIDYYSNSTRQSYIINNNTNYIYKIIDVVISKIKNNLVLINNIVYDYILQDDFTLKFVPLYNNSRIVVYDFIKDVYGNKYVFNDKIDEFDANTNTKFIRTTKQTNYFLSKDNIVFYVYMSNSNKEDVVIKRFNENRELVKLNEEDNYDLNIKGVLVNFEEWTLSKIKNGYAYFFRTNSTYNTVEFKLYDSRTDKTYYRLINCSGTSWNTNTILCTYLDDENVFFYSDLIENKGKVFVVNVWGNLETVHKNEWHVISNKQTLEEALNLKTETKPNLILDNVYAESWDNYDISKIRVSTNTLNGSTYYKFKYINNKVEVINEANYIPEKAIDILLRPINRYKNV